MDPAFRASMGWLHTWAGVVLGALLFAVFWMGTLSVFDREIDLWMMPTRRLPAAEKPLSFDALRPSLDAAIAAGSPSWSVFMPGDRETGLRMTYRDRSGLVRRIVDPATGAALPEVGTWGGTQFIYPFHYMLHIRLGQIGLWLVGLSAMSMLVLCVSGIIVHRKIFADFFTVRPERKARRLTLDIHNVSGVLALPFYVVVNLSGLVVFYSTYMPGVWHAAYASRQIFNADAFNGYARPKLNKPGRLASLDEMAAKAQHLWNGDAPRTLVIFHPGDAAAYVLLSRPYDRGVVASPDVVWFDGASGELLQQRTSLRPVMTAQAFVTGPHLLHFRHWTLRWCYFALGLVGCLLIATGYLFWLEARRKKHAQLGPADVRVVEGLATGSVTGIVIATLSFFVVNRLLPLGTSFLGVDRAALEIWTFYLVWLGTFTHAWLRPGRGWLEQCWIIAALAIAAVLLNWITTGDDIVRSLSHRHLWPIAGMDLVMILGGAIAGVTAWQYSIKIANRSHRG